MEAFYRIMHNVWRRWKLSVLLYSQHECWPLAVLAPEGCWSHMLALCTGSTLKAEFVSASRQTSDSFSWDSKQATDLGLTLFSRCKSHPSCSCLCRKQGCLEAWTELCWAVLALVATQSCITDQKCWCSVTTPHGWLFSETCQLSSTSTSGDVHWVSITLY